MPVKSLEFTVQDGKSDQYPWIRTTHARLTEQHAARGKIEKSIGITNDLPLTLGEVYGEGGRVVGLHTSCLGADGGFRYRDGSPVVASCVVIREPGDKTDYHFGYLATDQLGQAGLDIDKALSLIGEKPMKWKKRRFGAMSAHTK